MNTAETWFTLLRQHYPIDIDIISKNVSPPKKVRPKGGPHPKRSAWNVHKFGGSSFENADSYSFVGSLINKFEGKNLIVVSALSGITNQLYSVCARAKYPDWLQSEEWIQLITRISSTIKGRLGNSGFKETKRFAADLIYLRSVLSRMASSSPKDQDDIEQLVVGYGEIWSARLMTITMQKDYHRSAAFLDAREVLVVNQNGSKIDVMWDITKERLKKWFFQCRWCDVLIVTGFIARTTDEMPTTLKRNGSDFSATIFSFLTKANSVTIWKDVDGMYSADPKKNPDAKFIPEQTYEEAEEASRQGAFVIQADCIEPAKLFSIPIYLRNCFKLDCPGTRIGNTIEKKHEIPEESIPSEHTVDHLMESIEENVHNNDTPSEIYQMCSNSETRHRSTSHAEDHTILEIIV